LAHIHGQPSQEIRLESYVNMIRSRAWNYAKSYGMDYDDVEAEGFKVYAICLGKFNPGKASFSTYLFNNLNGRLNDYCEGYVNRTYLDRCETDILSKAEAIIGLSMGVNGVPADALNAPSCIGRMTADYSESRDRFLDFAQDCLSPFAFWILKYLVDLGFAAGSKRKPTVKKIAKVLSVEEAKIQNAFDELRGFWLRRGHDFYCEAT